MSVVFSYNDPNTVPLAVLPAVDSRLIRRDGHWGTRELGNDDPRRSDESGLIFCDFWLLYSCFLTIFFFYDEPDILRELSFH